jgi:Mlc titration factor MtfA (ptsG expression regulator)
LTVYEDGLCSGCGQPRERAWNEDMEGWYEAHRVLCQACQAVRLDMDAHGASSPAESVFVTDASPAGFDPDPRMAPKI